ncbi:efflux RND transporter periplasmic adaptor subunit [Quisquiliibacterium transsilvanicum]|uniref:Membrane fusion protein (Multidrug efflux system) n=1 Tax=Quisquiliibacterium transsilvanicum TaxID=1549638 RepID=A0A7W8HFL1_9BURK|nr:efflux RND transporter periplasmic adaptor subunit [Quisquiliibacterium transsilvanicum]MBB5271111.1 membrane fusion protein (multidrug efflux system) [Quisquiliibacterium transsilvanicum]
MKKVSVILLAVAGLLALGWWGYRSQRVAPGAAVEITEARSPAAAARPGGAAASRPGGSAAAGPVGVEVAQAAAMAMADEVQAVGTLKANESVVVRPEIAGRIVAIGFSDGARVARGALLVSLDASVLAAQAEQARAELALAQTSFERTRDLAGRQFVSGSALDQAAATLKVQQARLSLAEAQLAKTRIRAPFGGVLGLRNVSVGEVVKDGAELVMLEDVSSMKVDLRLPERFLGQLRPGQSIGVEVDAFPGKSFLATLDALDAQVDANGRSVLARGRLANPDGALRSGMFAKARIVLREKPQATVVPEEAILPVGADSFIFRIEDGKALRVAVRTGLRRDGRVEILDGVRPGDTVVVAGHQRLTRDAMAVRVVDAGAAQEAAPGPGPASGPAAGAAARGG